METVQKERLEQDEQLYQKKTIPVEYSIWDPTGNITALVESPVERERQHQVASELMERHPEVEQVGFVRLEPSIVDGVTVDGRLHMAGGEFCGNASASTAALSILRKYPDTSGEKKSSMTIRLLVSGTGRPVEVFLTRESRECFYGGIHMPSALDILEREFTFDGISECLTVVRMEGISHIMIESGSSFFRLKNDPEAAGRAVQDWCGILSVEALGLMFLEGLSSMCILTPLVYVPGSGTLFWENSCASGSCAAGMYLSAKNGNPSSVTMTEPGGRLRVETDPGTGETWLCGRIRFMGQYMKE